MLLTSKTVLWKDGMTLNSQNKSQIKMSRPSKPNPEGSFGKSNPDFYAVFILIE